MKKPIRRGEEVQRSKFTVKTVNDGRYELYSHEYDINYVVTIRFYGIIKLSVGDVIELPDYMLKDGENRPLFSNRLLQFCEVNDRMAIPKKFNVELDYAYVTYKDTDERTLIQRCYG
ncbi:MAG: hypothetical protein IKA02_01940 [Clostridia bacterium]|nr:hypothetical protein [Clostridia bacterium]